MKCRHPASKRVTWNRPTVNGYVLTTIHCDACHVDLPLGLANDAPPEVQIEIRAAILTESVAAWADAKGDDERRDAFANLASEGEEYGAIIFYNGGTPGDDSDGGYAADMAAEWAGYLACAIATHRDTGEAGP